MAGLGFMAGMPAIPSMSSSASASQSSGSFSGGNFTVGGESTQMYLFVGAAILIGGIIFLSMKGKKK